MEGYILYKISGWQDRDPRRTLSVEEIVAATQRAREASLSFMAGLDPLVYGIKLFTPRGEPLHPYLRSSHVDAKIEPDQMLRLVDVEGALGTSDARQRRRSYSTYQTTSYRRTPASTPSRQAKFFVGRRRGERLARRTPARPALRRVLSGQRPCQARARPGELSRSSRSPGGAPGDPWLFGPDHF